MKFEAARRASIGARSYQEDACAFWPGDSDWPLPDADLGGSVGLLAVLADGMGGHAGGSLASTTVCEHFFSGYLGSVGPTRERLRAGLNASNRAIELTVEQQPHLDGMGSTLIGAAFGKDGLEWVSVGDSPLYLYRRGEVVLINEDHSLAPALDQLAAAGRITFEQARNDPRRHMLRSAVTGEDLELVDLCAKPLVIEPEDCVVLASDGIHSLESSEIARIIMAYVGDGPEAIAAALVREVEALRDPQQDNISVVVVRPVSD